MESRALVREAVRLNCMINELNLPDFEYVYGKYHKSVLRYLSGRCASLADAEDITQDIFEYVYKILDRFDPQKASLGTWLYIIVRCRLKNYYRSRKIAFDIDELVDVDGMGKDDMERAVWLNEIRNKLAHAIKCLNEKQQQVVAMRYIEGISNHEIASRLQMTEINVRVTLSRALAKIRVNPEINSISVD